MNWKLNVQAKAETELTENSASFKFLENTEETYVELTYALPFEADGEEYVLLPSCCYDGNRFDVLKKDYPPLFTPEEARVDMPVTITDVPRLNKDGSGKIQITTGDVSVPCVGVYSKKEKKAVFVFTIQEIDGKNLGLSYEKGSIGITYPRMRKDEMYIWPHMRKSIDTGRKFAENQKIEIPFKTMEFACESMEEFYHLFFLNRKCMGMSDKLNKAISREEQFEIQKNKMNKFNWQEEGQFYGVETQSEGNMVWQAGWVGGGMYTYPLMKLGGELEWERGMKTLEHVCRGISRLVSFMNPAMRRGILPKESSEKITVTTGL